VLTLIAKRSTPLRSTAERVIFMVTMKAMVMVMVLVMIMVMLMVISAHPDCQAQDTAPQHSREPARGVRL
jgi:heme/copper-type cytochrome/quinol oxidase subunit 2